MILDTPNSPKAVRIHEENEIIQVNKIDEESLIENVTTHDAETIRTVSLDDSESEEQLDDKSFKGIFIYQLLFDSKLQPEHLGKNVNFADI